MNKAYLRYLATGASILTLIFSSGSRAADLDDKSNNEFNVGFNQAWLGTYYSGQWQESYVDAETKKNVPVYSAAEADRMLDLTKNAGGKNLRIWLFEGQNSTALKWSKDGKVEGLDPAFLKTFEKFLLQAKAKGIQVYPTLFDANAFNDMPAGPMRDRWWNLMNDKNGGLDAFKKNALEPLFKLLNRPDLRSTISGLDIANEMDAAVNHNRFEKGWEGANKLICNIRSQLHEAKGSGKPIPVTASIGWPMIPLVNRAAADVLLDPNPHPNCVDFWDLHLYNNGGTIPNCAAIKAFVKKYQKKIYLGEFGQFSGAYDDKLQKSNAESFIANAKRCGFSGALAWRLSDVRPGYNPEARYSYEGNGGLRPAYEVIKSANAASAPTFVPETGTGKPESTTTHDAKGP